MKQVEVSGTIEQFMGKNLDKPISFKTSADQFETPAEAREKGEWLSDGQILKAINVKLVNAARAAEYAKLTEPLREAYEKSDEYKRKNLVDSMIAAGFTADEANALADQKLKKTA